MSEIVRLLRLLYPFLQEFGLKEVNIKKFIMDNKSLSYMFLMCLILFTIFTYALEQAYLRMIDHNQYVRDHEKIVQQLNVCKKSVEQLQSFCRDTSNTGATELTVEELLETHNVK